MTNVARLLRYRCQTRILRSFGTASSRMATAREQPPWRQPSADLAADLPPLKIYNSLTRSKTPFIPLKSASREVSWYACGPTVYDDAHLGHARAYVTTDIIRRILQDYFKLKINFVMNITDVDDKVGYLCVFTAASDRWPVDHPARPTAASPREVRSRECDLQRHRPQHSSRSTYGLHLEKPSLG